MNDQTSQLDRISCDAAKLQASVCGEFHGRQQCGRYTQAVLHTVRHPCCVFIKYIGLNQFSNTTNLCYIYVYYIDINYMFRCLWPSSGWWIDKNTHKQLHLACVFCTEEEGGMFAANKRVSHVVKYIHFMQLLNIVHRFNL